MVLNKKLSDSVKEGTSYRTTLKNIVNLAEGILFDLFPELTREKRIIMAQEKPLFTACKENRKPTKIEILELQIAYGKRKCVCTEEYYCNTCRELEELKQEVAVHPTN